jgi:hypothetical protein
LPVQPINVQKNQNHHLLKLKIMKTIIQIASLRRGLLKSGSFLAIMLMFIALNGLHAQRTLPTTDQFDYGTGPLQTVGVDWTRISGSANDLVVTEGNITYNGYLGAKGRKATMTNGAADDLKLNFTGQAGAGTTVYASFVMNVLNTTGLSASGTYCFILGSGTGNFAGRIFMKISGTGYVLGISKTATAPVSWSSAFTVATSHLIVLGYEIKTGSSNDIVSLWIDPPITTIQPGADFSTSTGSDFGGGSSIDGFMLRQATGTPNVSIDNIGISTSWSDLFKDPVYTSSGSIGTGSFNNLTVTGSSTSLTMTGNISINGTLSLSDAVVNPAGNTLSYATTGILKYSGIASQTTTVNEFPALGGPNELIIENQAGVILNLDRSLNGNMIIKTGSMLSINPLKTLTVYGNTNLNDNESLIIRSDANGTGSFIDNGVINGAGTAKVERYLTGYTNITDVKYHFISTPVVAQPIQPGFVADPPLSGDDFYEWDEPSAAWINTKNGSGSWNTGFETVFEPGKGYMASYPADMTKQFTGNLNTHLPGSPMTITCSWNDPASGGGGGWNLLGNPYPSAIDWNLVTRGNGIDNALYYYDASVENYRYYIQYLPGFALGNGSQYIPAMQGFMVHASNPGDHTISIDNSCRVHQSLSIYYKNSVSMKNVLKLKVENEDRVDELFVLLRNDAGPEFDGLYDAYKLLSLNPAVPQVYSITPDKTELAVNTLPGNEGNLVVPVGFRAGTNGTFTITAEGTHSFDPGTMITIEDLKTGTTRNLAKDPAYIFTAGSNDTPERFLLHFSGINGINGQFQQPGIRIYANNHIVYILPGQNFHGGMATLYTLSGQEILKRKLLGPELTSFHVDVYPGLYLVKVISDGNIQVKKILIQ